MKLRFNLIVLAVFVFSAFSINAQNTAFTYQGSLNDNSTEANGTYEMRFSLFTAETGGIQVNQTNELTNVSVSEGIFSVELDFGLTAFANGSPRFLQIEVRRNPNETYVPLNPRQHIKSVPYAVRSVTSGNADQLGGVSSTQYVTNSSNAFIANSTTTQTGNFNISGRGTANNIAARDSYLIGNNQFLFAPNKGTNAVLGLNSGQFISSGEGNAIFGNQSGAFLSTGSFNTFVGVAVGVQSNSDSNTFVGANAGSQNTTGSEGVFVGRSAGAANTTGTGNTFIGRFAGSSNSSFSNSTFVGKNAGQDSNAAGNSFFGMSSGSNNTSGSSNTFIGLGAGDSNIVGRNNTLLGSNADVVNDPLIFATAIGSDSVVATSNTIQLGRPSDRTNVSGKFNVLSGRTFSVERGDVNFVTSSGNMDLYMQGNGNGAGFNFGVSTPATGNSSLFISHFNGTTYQDRITINSNGIVRLLNLGTGGSTSLCRNASGQVSTCSSSMRYKSNVSNFSNGLDIVKKLRPVSFNWTEGGMLDFGLVAEEVAEVEPLLTTQNADGKTEGVKYDRVGVVLVNAVKEQQKQIEDQQAEIKKQKETIEKQQVEIENLKKQQKEFSALKALVCLSNVEAEICKAEEITEDTQNLADESVKEKK